jgi:alkylation response protein AidB-like acyl-CoA dehydrogenase
MAVATSPYVEKTDEQKAITDMVRQFADEQILPNAEHYDHEDEFPQPIVEQMNELGLFGVTIPEEFGGMGLDLTTYSMIVEELSRGWISISGIVNTQFIGSHLLMKFGSEEQRRKYLPRMASGEIRAAFSLSEPEVGSDVQAIKTSARRLDDGDYEINGQKMWVTNGLMSAIVFVLVKTDPRAEPRHRGMTCFIAEKEPGVGENSGEHAGLTVSPKIKKLGYKGVESTELIFDGYRCPAGNVLGGEEDGLGRGFSQMMDALEVGRVNVAARGVGIAQRALELALAYSQERKAFGKPIAEHQAIQFKLADMATQVDAARLLTLRAARLKDAGGRSDLEAGMAKLFASEAGRLCVEESFRIHGGYGYSTEYEIERLYRDAPLLLIGEGTSEVQRMVIGKKLSPSPRRGARGPAPITELTHVRRRHEGTHSHGRAAADGGAAGAAPAQVGGEARAAGPRGGCADLAGGASRAEGLARSRG